MKKIRALNDNIIVELLDILDDEDKEKLKVVLPNTKEFHAGPIEVPKTKIQRGIVLSLGEGFLGIEKFFRPNIKVGDIVWFLKDVPLRLPNGYAIVKYHNLIGVEEKE